MFETKNKLKAVKDQADALEKRVKNMGKRKRNKTHSPLLVKKKKGIPKTLKQTCLFPEE
jgi:hypothetical protein